MSIFKCKMCGGTLEVKDGTTVCECDYCGTTQTLPKTDNEQTINMLNRASHFRQQCEFDKAMEIYEKLLDSSDKDSEIYWQIVLCRYGIEYVDDPLTKKKIPTCHRTQFNSILKDGDYLEALNHADSIQKDVYIKEAEYIDNIQKGILEISNKEDPFDVFICYKESDENGKRTHDSVLAQDLYYQLEREGFKVFFSRITLEGKLGTAYEPYIFAALNSAKVMVVVGTKPEYFNAVWVRNEWSRYLMLMQNDRSKTIIPAYKDIDPYDLPDALSMFQAQDMSKLGFMQDLIRGIKKLTNSKKKKEVSFNDSKNDTDKVRPLLKRSYMFLEDGDWKSADNYAEKALDSDPESAEAYLIKLLADLKLKSKTELINQKEEFSNNSYYKKAIKYADDKLKQELEDYSNERAYQEALSNYNSKYYNAASEIFKRIPEYKDSEKMAKECLYVLGMQRLENKMYQEAESVFKQIQNYKDAAKMEKECVYRLAVNRFEIGSYSDAENIFLKIPDYNDSNTMIEKCREKADIDDKDKKLKTALYNMKSQNVAEIEKAIEILKSIRDWKNSEELISECESKISNIELQNRKLKEKSRRKKKIIIISSAAAGLIIIGFVIYIVATIPVRKYDEAMERWENGEYNYSYNLLSEIPDYKDSANAMKLLSVLSGGVTDYDEKVKILESLGDYRDSEEILLDLKYEKASELAADKNYREAVELIDSMGDYGDPDNIKQDIYITAISYFDDHKFSESAEIFLILGKYEESEEYVEKIYEQAGKWFKDKKYNYSAAVYTSLGDYKESKDKVEELYKKCLDYIEKEKYTDAIPILKNLKDYKDSESKIDEIYDTALKFVQDKKYDKAIKIFEKFGKYKESESKLNEITELQNKEEYDKAVKLGKDEKYDEAIKLFKELGDYGDSKDQIKEMEKKRDADTYELKGTAAWVVINDGYLNVRKTANSDAESVGKLYNGDEVTIQATSSNGKWYKVSSGSVTGYCSVDYISTSKPIPDLSGTWIEVGEENMPRFMEITSNGDNYFYIEVHMDGDNFTWTFSGEYDYKTGLLNYNNGIYTTKYIDSIIQNTDLPGSLSYSNGYIYWSFPGNGNREFVFERN